MAEFKPIPNVIVDQENKLIQVCVPRFKNPEETKKMTITENFIPMYDRIKNMEVYEDDVWLVTYPKCGTTWAQEMMWLICNNLDYETAKKEDLLERFPYLE